MKKIFPTLITILTLNFSLRAQDLNSASWLNSILKYAVSDAEKEKSYVVHAETGICTINKSNNRDYTSRTLFQGTTYLIRTFTDTRIEDFKLRVWKWANGQWERYDSSNVNNKRSLNIKGLGDKEAIKIAPAADGDYAFELVSNSAANKTGRYAIMIEAANNSSTTTTTTTTAGKFFASCDTVYDANLKIDKNNNFQVDGNWTFTRMNTLFEINPQQTVITHTTPDMTSSYFVQSKSNDGVIFTYEVKSDAGNTYTFKLDTKGYMLHIYGKTSAGQNFVRSWHVKRMWKE